MPQTKRLGDTTERISRRDLQNERIRALGRHDAIAVDAGTPIDDVIRQMQASASTSRGAAVVTRDGRLAGIFTERDVLLKVIGSDVDTGAAIETIMTPDPETLTADGSLGEALAMMEQGHFRHIPLVEGDGAVVGILSQQDVLEYVAEAFPQEILNLPPRPHQKMEKEEGG